MPYSTENELALDSVRRNIFNITQSLNEYSKKDDVKYLNDVKEMLEYSILIVNRSIKNHSTK